MPGDKSISHRYAMLAAVAYGNTVLENFSTGADCASTLACLQQTGVSVQHSGNKVTITGREGRLDAPQAPLDCGNSGSTMRMLSGILAGQNLECELVGDSSLMRRPMERIVEPLRRMGAEIGTGPEGRPPVRIAPSKTGSLKAVQYVSPVASAQVKSAVLFAGLFAEGETRYSESLRTRDHSELALRAFGAEVERSGGHVGITGGQKLLAIEASVPGDISSAAFFLSAAAIFPGSNLVLEHLGLNPTRTALLDVLAGMGARVGFINVEEHHQELVGTLKIEHGGLRGTTIKGALAAQLIDELPVLAAIAPYTEHGIEICDARELRVKETDRIAAVADNLRRMGAEVEEREDGLRVPGGQSLHGAEVDSHGDHRIAMAFAVAALRAEGETTIHGADAAVISFPEFWTMLEAVSER